MASIIQKWQLAKEALRGYELLAWTQCCRDLAHGPPCQKRAKKIFPFPSSDVICLRRENNTSHHSYLGLIREEGQACCLPRGEGDAWAELLSEAQLGEAAQQCPGC